MTHGRHVSWVVPGDAGRRAFLVPLGGLVDHHGDSPGEGVAPQHPPGSGVLNKHLFGTHHEPGAGLAIWDTFLSQRTQISALEELAFW